METLFNEYQIQLGLLFKDRPLQIKYISRKSIKLNDVMHKKTFQELSQTGQCMFISETPAIYYPVKVNGEVEAILVAFPLNNEKEWFINNRKMIESGLSLASSCFSADIEKNNKLSENVILKNELKRLFAISDDLFMLISQDGTIEEISECLSRKIKWQRAEIIGDSILKCISKSDFKSISTSNQQKEIILFFLNNDNSLSFTTSVNPIFHKGNIESFLLKMHERGDRDKKLTIKRSLYCFEDIKGVSDSIQSAVNMAKRIAASNTTILLRGESGTGKEVFAQSIHKDSNRSNNPFIAINCAAIPENLLESELFGYVNGAFTGAKGNKPGRFELANGGTIFLDEIGDMSLNLQSKLLRVVQERKIERVGGLKSIDVNVRIITATHQDLEKLVQEGLFREDLYYRLNVIPLIIPPLRDRKEDIPLLVEFFMTTLSDQSERLLKRLSEEVHQLLFDYEWPGNVRELQNVVQHFVELEIGDMVTIESLPDYLKKNTKSSRTISVTYKNNEKEDIIFLLDECGRDTSGKKKVANKLGISLPTLYRRIKRLGVR